MVKSFSSAAKEENIGLWRKIIKHPFIEKLGKLELQREKFRTFIEQDYQYLLGFIRCLGLFLAKSKQKQKIMDFKNLVEINIEEIQALEKSYQKLGYSKDKLRSAKPFLATESYKSYILLQGYEGTKFEILGAILPCDWIFADIGKKLNKESPEPSKDYHHVYLNWITSYASKNYQKSIKNLRQEIDEKSKNAGKREKKNFRKNFETGLRFEHSFFNAVYTPSQDPPS